MKWINPHWKLILFSAVHALFISFLTLVWMNLSWEFGDEVIVARINQIARYEIFNPRNKMVEQFKRDLLLINTSYDKTLIAFEDDYGSGKRPITDRAKMAALFHLINSAPIPPDLVVVDLLFEDASPEDSVLQAELRRIPNLVISSQLDNNGQPVAPWPGLHFALAQYSTTTGTFLKYNLVNDTVNYLPAAMYHETQGTRFEEWAGLVRSFPGWWINSFIVDLPVRQVHIDNGEVLIWNMGDVITYPPREVQQLVANKVIIVGDMYKYDLHQTLLGTQPGPLIVANAYLGMLQGIPRIKLLDGFLIFLLYFVSTLYVLIWRPRRSSLTNLPAYQRKVGKFALKNLTYLLIFSFYSIFLYLLTSRHFQLLLFGLYFNLFEYLINRYRVKLRLTEPPIPVEAVSGKNDVG